MEVHHHGHIEHNTLWKQYLSQFSMLFLAVFCGTLAEYYLDHNLENEKEEQYAVSMIQDLDEDLVNINIDLKNKTDRIHNADSLTALVFSGDKNSNAKIYYLARKISVLGKSYIMTDGTLMELKSSGNLRLIKSKALVDSIQSYYNVYQQFQKSQVFAMEELNYYREQMIQVFDVRVFDTMINRFPKIDMPKGNPPLFNNDPILMNRFLMRVELAKTSATLNVQTLKKMRASAIKLRDVLNKKYNVE
jgi:hypothetical protein